MHRCLVAVLQPRRTWPANVLRRINFPADERRAGQEQANHRTTAEPETSLPVMGIIEIGAGQGRTTDG